MGFDWRSRAPTPTWRNDTQVVPYGGGGCERALWAMQRAKRSVAVKSYWLIAVNNFWAPQEVKGDRVSGGRIVSAYSLQSLSFCKQKQLPLHKGALNSLLQRGRVATGSGVNDSPVDCQSRAVARTAVREA